MIATLHETERMQVVTEFGIGRTDITQGTKNIAKFMEK